MSGKQNTHSNKFGNQDTRSNNLVASIDWIAFTSTVISSAEEMMNFLGYFSGEFVAMPKGAYGYKHMYRLNGFPITILSGGTEEMGVHVVISGSAVSDMLKHFSRTLKGEVPFCPGEWVTELSDFDNTIMIEFFQHVRHIGWFTRLDLAVDDFGANFFSVEDVREYIDRQEVVSKFRSFRDVYESTLENKSTGHTLYLGSRQSEIMLRIYDKQLEQNKKAATPEEKQSEPWVRWELELKNERANVAVELLVNHKELGEVIMSILNNYVRLIVPDDCNRSRCSSLPLWEKFVGAVGQLRLFVEQKKKSLDESRKWLVHQCLPTIAGIIIADGGTYDFITQHFENAVSRMSSHLRQLVMQANPDYMECAEWLCSLSPESWA